MYCGNCGKLVEDGSRFCGYCGYRFPINIGGAQQFESHQNSNGQHNRGQKKNAESWIDKLNDYVGNDRPADLNWKVLFTDIFKKHTVEEAEDIFICGTHKTTPPPQLVSQEWPHPWLYSRVFMTFLIAFFLLWLCCSVFNNTNAMPGMMVVGSFAVPMAVMVLFMEINAWRNVSMFRVIQMFLVGGCASLVATLFLFSIYSAEELDFFGALVTGIIEETGKAVIVFYFIKKLEHPRILSGMLVGGCVGAGFAAFESAGYAMQPMMRFLQYSGYAAAYGQEIDIQEALSIVYSNIILRGVLAPGGHVAWAAITGSAFVIASKAKVVFSYSLFTETKFLRLFILPIAMHAIWDSPLAAVGSDIFLVPACLIVLAWIILLILINMGLSEVGRTNG